MTNRYSNQIKPKTLISISDFASVIGYDPQRILRLVSQGDIDIDVFQKVVPGTVFSVLRNHTKGSGFYPDYLATSASPYYLPSIYALSLPLEKVITLCTEGKTSCRFFSGGLAAQRNEYFRLFCVDKNFLPHDFPAPYHVPFLSIDDNYGVGVYASFPGPSSRSRTHMYFRRAGLASNAWHLSLPFKTIERAIPRMAHFTENGLNGECFQAAAPTGEKPQSVKVCLNHMQTVWLGVYEQLTAETSKSFLWCRPYTPFSRITRPEFYPGKGYQEPKAINIRIEDLGILFEDAIFFIEEKFKGNPDEVGNYRKKLLAKAEKNQKEQNEKVPAPSSIEIDSELWQNAYKSAIKTIERQGGGKIDTNVFSKLVHLLTAADYSWQKTSVLQSCDPDVVGAALSKNGALNDKQVRSMKKLIRTNVGSPGQDYKKKSDNDPCILNTFMRTVLDEARLLEERRPGSGKTRRQAGQEMERDLSEAGVTSQEAKEALYGIIVPDELYEK